MFLEISQNSQENLQAVTLFKKRLWHRCFHVNFAKFLRTSVLQNTSSVCFWSLSKIAQMEHQGITVQISNKLFLQYLRLELIYTILTICFLWNACKFDKRSRCWILSSNTLLWNWITTEEKSYGRFEILLWPIATQFFLLFHILR